MRPRRRRRSCTSDPSWRSRTDGILVSVEEHVEVGVRPLDLLNSLHDVLQGNRLVVRVDPHDNSFCAVRPHGLPLLRTPLETVRPVRPYKYYSGAGPLGDSRSHTCARLMDDTGDLTIIYPLASYGREPVQR